MRSRRYVVVVALLVAAAGVQAQSASTEATRPGEQVYRAACSLCHDGGQGNAPRLGDSAAWQPRIARGKADLYSVALLGKPDTAMAPKGGFSKLSAAEVTSAVDYMVSMSGGYSAGSDGSASAAVATAKAPTLKPGAGGASDKSIADALATALRAEGFSSSAVKYDVAAGVVTLRGMVKDADQVHRAEAAARAVQGVRQVDNKLISASLFQWD